MGNRCVITTQENYEKGGIGVYLHWNGGRDSVTAFLTYCKLKGYRPPEQDCYGWARLCQVLGNFFGGSLSVGIDCYNSHLFNPGDNGVYIIRDWEIVGRMYSPGWEQDEHDLEEMLKDIDSRMPDCERLGDEYLSAEPIAFADIKVGDIITFVGWDGSVEAGEVEGFETGKVYGCDFENVPYMLLKGTKCYLPANLEYRIIEQ